MPDNNQLSRRERQLMDILYSSGKVTTEEIRARMKDPPSGNAVRTLLHILEKKGYLHRRKTGREYLYEPTQRKSHVGIGALQHVLTTFYEGSIEKALTAHLTRRQVLQPGEYRRLAQIIDEARKKEKKS